MSKQPILIFNQVSKRFTFDNNQPGSLLESLITQVRPEKRPQQQVQPGELWALRDVSFAVTPGESVGIIGRNGSGKSTLLKLASRIIQPTTGTVRVRGRVSALLELGAGFHPDLTGRENIFLNGSLLGLSRQEMEECYQDIVDFSELHNYIQMPVKHYSSGMYMRLGFSVAIHVKPDILIVDEILAVGDRAFQDKCIQRVHKMKQEGITVVMVTHNLESLRGLCSQAVWIEHGVMQAAGPTDDIVAQYLSHTYNRPIADAPGAVAGEPSFRRWGSRAIEITQVRFLNSEGQPSERFKTHDTVIMEMQYIAHEPVEDPAFGLAIFRADGVQINSPNILQAGGRMGLVQGAGVVRYRIEHLPLLAAEYKVTAAVYDQFVQRPLDHHDRAYLLHVIGGGSKEIEGVLAMPAVWEWEAVSG